MKSNCYRIRLQVIVYLTIFFACGSSAGTITFTFEPTSSGTSTLITASGHLDISGLVKDIDAGASLVSAYSDLSRRDFPIDDSFLVYDGSSEGWTIGASAQLFAPPTDFFFEAQPGELERTGDPFGLSSVFDGDRLDRLRIISDRGFVSGPVFGTAVLRDLRLDEINPIEQTFSWVNTSGEKQFASIIVVPEPSTFVSFLLSMLLLGYRRKRS